MQWDKTKSGEDYCKFQLSKSFKKKDGTKEYQNVSVIVWNSEILKKFSFGEGSRVTVTGDLKADAYMSKKTNQPASSITISVGYDGIVDIHHVEESTYDTPQESKNIDDIPF